MFNAFKTAAAKVKELKQWILEKHPYSVPALLSGTLDSSSDFYTYVQSKVL